MNVELPNGVVIRDVPDHATDEEIKNEAIRLGVAQDSDFMNPQQRQAERDKLQSNYNNLNQQAKSAQLHEAALGDYSKALNVVGAPGQVARTYLQGIVAAPISGLYGIGAGSVDETKALSNGVPVSESEQIGLNSGAQSFNKSMNKLGYEPNLPLAKGVIESNWNPLNWPHLIGSGAGNKVLDATGSPALATAVDVPIEFAANILGAKAIKSGANKVSEFQNRNNENIAKIRSGSYENALAPYEVVPKKGANPLSGQTEIVQPKTAMGEAFDAAAEKQRQLEDAKNFKLVKNPEAQLAEHQGWDQADIQMVNNASPDTLRAMHKALSISEKGKADSKYAADNPPDIALGDIMARKAKLVKDKNKEAGAEISSAVKTLHGVPIDISAPVSNFKKSMHDRFNVALDDSGDFVRSEDGKIDFSGSLLDADTDAMKGVRNHVDQITRSLNREDTATAYGAHRLKETAGTLIDWSKRPDGVEGKFQDAMKGLYRDTNQKIGEVSEPYAKANQKFSETKDGLDALQKYVGKNADLFGDYSDVTLGNAMRRMLSRNVNAQEVRAAASNIAEIAKKYGDTSNEDLMTLVQFASKIDEKMGTTRGNSIEGAIAKGNMEANRKIDSVNGQTTAIGLGIEGVKKLNQLRKRQTQERAYQSMKDLVKKQYVKKGGSKAIEEDQ